jgi:Protein of unknown function (DUF3224)
MRRREIAEHVVGEQAIGRGAALQVGNQTPAYIVQSCCIHLNPHYAVAVSRYASEQAYEARVGLDARRPIPSSIVAMLAAAILASTSPFGASAAQGADRMSVVAKGSFSVEMKPQSEPDVGDGVSLGRMSLDKRFEGDLVAIGKGEMLTALTPVKGSAGYVAVERVTGALHGHSGSFVFQHTGTMNRGAQQLSITVVPDSGTGALAGISGTFKLDIVEGKHLYEFEYALPQ